MPDLVEQMYCAEQIHIPPTFPYILKQYAKAAIRTQPYDLLRWSAAYFRAMANGDEPPVKVRLEYPPIELPSGLTPGYLKVLLKQFQNQTIVQEDDLFEKWKGMCLNESALLEMLNLGNFDEEFEFLKFIAVAAGHLTNSLSQTMVLLCELLTEEPEGGSAMIPCDTFCDLYTFLARMDCGPPRIEAKVGAIEEGAEGEVKGEEEEEEETPDQRTEHIASIVEEIVEHSTVPPTERISTIVDEMVEHATIPRNEPAASIVEEMVRRATVSHGEPIASSLVEDIIDTVEHSAFPCSEPAFSIVEEIVERSTIQQDEPADFTDEDVFERATIPRAEPAASIVEEIVERATLPNAEPISSIVEEIFQRSTLTRTDTVASIIEKIVEAVPIQEDPEVLARIARREQRKLRFAAEVQGIGPVVEEDQIESVVSYMKYWADRQEGMVMPRNVRHFLCPRLDPPGTVQGLEAEK
ncbi:uncharacterized protein [Anabrus simplex]|uniref:uncharacterized protein n=1 Tax=Anabrus simplex TaxID=316456 RepID=UPI0035A3ADDB